jgi:hypothetical protein
MAYQSVNSPNGELLRSSKPSTPVEGWPRLGDESFEVTFPAVQDEVHACLSS